MDLLIVVLVTCLYYRILHYFNEILDVIFKVMDVCVLWLQVSDQLVEINGDSTAGMTHSQAVEQIRRGGHRIHLVLKRGNGYVPDYGKDLGIFR